MTSSDDPDDIDDSYDIYDEYDWKVYDEDLYEGALELLRTKDIVFTIPLPNCNDIKE